jgi:hypothetical protein
MLGQLDMVRHPAGVGLGLLLVTVVSTVTLIAPAADDIALVALMTADDVGVGIAIVVVVAAPGCKISPNESATIACPNL